MLIERASETERERRSAYARRCDRERNVVRFIAVYLEFDGFAALFPLRRRNFRSFADPVAIVHCSESITFAAQLEKCSCSPMRSSENRDE